MNEDVMAPVPPGADGAAHGRVERVLRRAGVVEHPPPPHVWEAVVREVRRSVPVRIAGRSSARSGAHAGRPRRAWSAGAAGLLAAAAVGALVTWAGLELTSRDAPGEVLARGELAPLTDDGTAGSAEVVDVDGQHRLRVQLAGQPDPQDGYLEVWLLRPDVSGMVTLGVLEGEAGEFLLPEGIDLAEYAVVDISREHMDGDPGHGGDSLVRGQVG